MAEISILDETRNPKIRRQTQQSGANRSEISENHRRPKKMAENRRRESVATNAGVQRQVNNVTDRETENNDVTSTECDVFFSYNSKDKDWVFETAERLERDHDIVCSYDSKDFIGGKAITSNIMNCIKMSRKTVLVLSPDFLRSPWCEYEMQIVLREHLFRERKVVIPVLLHDCIIPDFISHLTYLEVKDPQFWEKFLELIKSERRDIGGLSEVFSFGHEADKFKGQTVYRENAGCRFLTPFSSPKFYNTLSSRGIRVTKEDFDCILSHTNERALHRCFCYFVCFQSWPINILRLAAMWLIPSGLLYVILYVSDTSISLPTGILISVIFVNLALIMVALIVSCVSFNPWTRNSFERSINRALFEHNIILGFVTANYLTGAMILHILYFKTSKCVDYLVRSRYFQDKKKVSKPSDDSIEDSVAGGSGRYNSETTPLLDTNDMESVSKEKALKFMAEICGEYVREVGQRKADDPWLGQRHTRQRQCLCQYIQSKKFKELV
ncbi:uncharacterized protein [Ptychodera flava]|uniref:uncharacterized protein n=1 Tax=Ptychodera flava TaxID=63121 RepID=UPI00396A0F69